MKNLQEIENVISTLNPMLSFDEVVEAVNKVIPITDEEMFELSENSMIIQNFIESVGC